MKRTPIISIAVASLVMSFCHAQDAQKISLQFIAFPAQTPLEPVELVVGENTTIPIEIPGHELSPEYKVPRQASITVGINTKNEKGEPTFQVLGNAPALASAKQIILLIRKGEKNSDGFTVVPIDGELDDFSGGSYLLVNVSQLSIGGMIGDKNFAIKPGQRSLIKPAATHIEDGCQVTLAYQKDETDQKGKKFYDTRWTVTERIRTLVFFYQDPETKKIGVAPIVNFL